MLRTEELSRVREDAETNTVHYHPLNRQHITGLQRGFDELHEQMQRCRDNIAQCRDLIARVDELLTHVVIGDVARGT